MDKFTARVRSIRAEILLQNPSALELGSSVRRSLNIKAAEQFDQLKRRYPGARFLHRGKRELWLGFVRMQLIRIASYNDGGQQNRYGGGAIGVSDAWSNIVRDFNKGISSVMKKVLQGAELKEALEKLLDSSAKAIDGYARAQRCARPGMCSKPTPSEGSVGVSSLLGDMCGNNNLESIEPYSFAHNLRKDAGYDSDDSDRSNGPRAGDPLLKRGDRNHWFCPKRVKVQPPPFQSNLRSRKLGLEVVAQDLGVSAHQQLAPTQPALSRHGTSSNMRITTLQVRGPMPDLLATIDWRNERPLSSYDYATRMNLHLSQGEPLGNSSFGGQSLFRQGPTFQSPQNIPSSVPQPFGREVPSELISNQAVIHTPERPRTYPAPGTHSLVTDKPHALPHGERDHHSYSAEDIAEGGNRAQPEYGAFWDQGGF